MKKRVVLFLIVLAMVMGLAVPLVAYADGDTRVFTETLSFSSWNPDTNEEDWQDITLTITLTGIIGESTEYFVYFRDWTEELGWIDRSRPFTIHILAPGAEITIFNPTDLNLTTGPVLLRRDGDEVGSDVVYLSPGTNSFIVGSPHWFFPESYISTWEEFRHTGNYEVLYWFGDVIFGVGVANQQPTDPTPSDPLDSASVWARDYLTRALDLELVPATLQGAYTQATTRAEFTALAVALYEHFRGEITGRVEFTDTNDVNVQKMAYLGVVTGVGGGRFNPNAQLTREQAATMLSRLAAVMENPLDDAAPDAVDAADISDWAYDAVGQMQAAEIMSGVGGGRFNPRGAYTREMSIITALRLFDLLG